MKPLASELKRPPPSADAAPPAKLVPPVSGMSASGASDQGLNGVLSVFCCVPVPDDIPDVVPDDEPDDVPAILQQTADEVASEALAAMRQGATAVKLFPASAVGPRYLTDLAGPLPGARIMPVRRT